MGLGSSAQPPWLAVPHAVFQFMELYWEMRVPWWDSARREVLAMARATMGLYADLEAPFADTLFATDAEGANIEDFGGYGVVGATSDKEVIMKVFERGVRPGKAMARAGGSAKVLEKEDAVLECTVPVSAVTPELLGKAGEWRPLLWGRWAYPDHITLGEARAVILLLEALAAHSRAHRHRVLNLEDNAPVAYSFEKGRSPKGPLNYLLRRRCALCVAAEIQLGLPWLETSRMPADWLSRQR